MTTTIEKWGNAQQGIRLPVSFPDKAKLQNNDTVNVIAEHNTVIIKEYQHKTLKQRVEEFYGKNFREVIKDNPYTFEECCTGEPIGNEIW